MREIMGKPTDKTPLGPLKESSDRWYEAWWAGDGFGPKICVYRHRLSRTWSWRGFFGKLEHVAERKKVSRNRDDAEREAREWAENMDPTQYVVGISMGGK